MRFPHFARRRQHVFALVLCGAVGMALPLLLDRLSPGLFEPIELWTIDLRFRIRPPLPVAANPSSAMSETLVAVDYDDRAVRGAGLGRWPWDRRLHVQVVDWLTQAGARAVMLDVLFADPGRDPIDDQVLAQIGKRSGDVIHPFAFRPAQESQGTEVFRLAAAQHLLHPEVQGIGSIPGVGEVMLPLPALIETARGLGHILRTPDGDGVLRRTPLVVAVKGGFVPALGLAAAFAHLDVDPASVRIDRGRAIRFKPRDEVEVVVPIDTEGRTWINYAGPWGQRFVHYPYSWLFDQLKSAEGEGYLARWFRDKSIVVASVATGLADQGATPFDRSAPLGEVHLHILNMLLTQQFLRDATRIEAGSSLGIPLGVLTAAALAGGPALILPTYAVVGGAYLIGAQRAFNDGGVILPVVNPILGLTVGLILLLAARFFIVDRERLRFRSALGACLPPQTVKEVTQSPERIPGLLAGRRRELTILFADIQGFSTFCQKADPLEIQRVLREYRTAITAILRAHGGTLDKYMGDGVLAFFGDAEPEGGGEEAEEQRIERHAANAVRAGLAIQKNMVERNSRWESQGRELHLIRIGINTGPVTVGNFGTEHLWDYTVVGAEVNKAQRLESAAEPGGLLLARRTYALARRQGVLPDGLEARAATLKGFGEEADLYLVPPDLVARLSVSAALLSAAASTVLRTTNRP